MAAAPRPLPDNLNPSVPDLQTAWNAEASCPHLLQPSPSAAQLQTAVSAQTDALRSSGVRGVELAVYGLELSRLNFLVAAYSRLRLHKVRGVCRWIGLVGRKASC